MTILEPPPEVGEITFVQFTRPLTDDEFFLIRQVDDIPTHWMTPYGQWVGFPDDDDEAAELFTKLVDDMDWPKWGYWDEDPEEEPNTQQPVTAANALENEVSFKDRF